LTFEERAKLLEGHTVHQITRMAKRNGGSIIELDHHVEKLLKWLPAGPTADGTGHRQHDLVQFIARHGGIRTCRAADLVVL
jgi:hypothetical protein